MKARKSLLCCAVAACLALMGVESWARSAAAEKGERALFIAADRVHGFVPFSVTVYGFVNGAEPGSIALCRAKIEGMSEPAGQRGDAWGWSGEEDKARPDPSGCVPGRLVPSKGGFAYENDLRFDRPGIYHVQLLVIDAEGHRRTSNTVRVSAF
jgi:hypothetical protein